MCWYRRRHGAPQTTVTHRCIVAVTAEEKKSGEGVIEEEMVLTKPFIERKKSGKGQ